MSISSGQRVPAEIGAANFLSSMLEIFVTDYTLLVVVFIAGMLVALGIGWLLHRRLISGLMFSLSTTSSRLADLESQLARQSEDFSHQLSQKAREHIMELEQLGRERRLIDENHLAEIKQRVREAEDRGYEDGKRQAELRADEKAKAFSVIVRPFIRKIRDDGFFKKHNKLEVGYQYQLQINGIPCFDPHVVIEQHYEEKEVNQEVIEKMTRLALEAAKTAVAIQAGPAGAFIPIADSPVIEG